jgi:hypothetical protein
MTKKQLIQLFEDRKVRTVWDDEQQKWFFSIVDVCHILTDSKDYRRLGYSDRWINQRLKSIEVRKELTDEWDRAGVKEGQQYASLTDIITKGWSGKTTKQYKQYKGLKKESLRDNMTNIELALNTLVKKIEHHPFLLYEKGNTEFRVGGDGGNRICPVANESGGQRVSL